MLDRNTSNRAEANYVFDKTKKRKRIPKTLFSDFKRDIILIKKPENTKTLTGLEKSSAYAKGYAVTAATFQKAWNEQEIMEYIKSLFIEKLGDIKFEILIPYSGTLVKLNLACGTVLNGTVMCRLFSQKNVYVRPLSTIIDHGSDDSEDEKSSDRINEDHNIAANHFSTENNIDNVRNTYNIVSDIQADIENDLSVVEDRNNIDLTVDEIFERETTIAIVKSMETTKEENMINVLKQFNTSIDAETTFQFNVYREDIFNCCIRALRRKNFSPLKKISVMFTDIDNISEGAIYMGGPTKEMFRLLLKYLATSTLFEGPEHSKNVTLCSEHLESKHYFEAGRIIALSIVHGGPAPQFFSETLFKYLIGETEAAKPNLNEITNMEIRKELESVRDAPDLPALQCIIRNSAFLTLAGFSNINNFDKKNTILESALKYYFIYRTTPALEQFKEGLNILEFLEKMKTFKEFKELMCYTDFKLTANKVASIFKVNLSEVGSNNRNIESIILAFWNDFLCDCQENETQATLEDVLCFVTASEQLPPLGFEVQPQIEFLHNEEFFWPKANTCVPILYLPVSYNSNEYEIFRKNMDYAILNGMQFGFA